MLQRIKNNARYIISSFFSIASAAFSLIAIIQMFVGWEIFNVEKTSDKIIIFCFILILCIIISLIRGIFFVNSNTIYSEDSIKIVVKYGNLLKIAFPKKNKKEKIVVIAVNRCFDTEVCEDIIKADTMHGQFLQKINISNIYGKIEKSLEELGTPFQEISRSEKKYGHLKRYPIGSIAIIPGENNITFFLLALTTFDSDCVAHCNKHEYVECILKLFEFYDKYGQGKDIYLYPMGLNMARTGLNQKEMLEIIVALTKLSKERLKSLTTIVVDKKFKNEIALKNLC